MTSQYEKPILTLGLFLPLGLILLLILILLGISFKINKNFKVKKGIYDKAQTELKQKKQLEQVVAHNEPLVTIWEESINKETRGSFVEHWKNAEKKFRGAELIRHLPQWRNESVGIGQGSKQPASQVDVSFIGTFRAMQQAFMEVETNLPQMQLDSMTMKPNKNGKLIDFKASYTVWTKE